MTEGKKKEMRELMPQTAAIVDELRQALGTDWANRLLRQGQAGRGGFWAQETGPDGVLREFGSKQLRAGR